MKYHLDDLSRDDMLDFVKKHLGLGDSDDIRIRDIYQFILQKEKVESHAMHMFHENQLTSKKLDSIKKIVNQ